MSRKLQYVYIADCEVVDSTAAAIKVLIDTSPVWIPKSQLHDHCDLWIVGDIGDLIIPDWLATSKDIEPDGEYETDD